MTRDYYTAIQCKVEHSYTPVDLEECQFLLRSLQHAVSLGCWPVNVSKRWVVMTSWLSVGS